MHRFLNFLYVCKSVTRPRFIPFGRLTGNVGSSIKGHIGQALAVKVKGHLGQGQLKGHNVGRWGHANVQLLVFKHC